jgi:hypothetical protein
MSSSTTCADFLSNQELIMDLSPIADAAATLASAVLAASAPAVVLKLSGMLKLNLDQSHRAAVTTALDNAVGIGLHLAQEAGDAHLGSVNIRSAALAAMVGYVKQAVPEAVSHFGLTDDSLAQKATARLAASLHVSAPSMAPAPASAPASATPASPIPAAA